MTPDLAVRLESVGSLGALGAAFAAGLVLAATPCVYPMIPVTVAAFGARRVSRLHGALLGLVYVAGVVTTYTALGLLAASTGRLFGAWLASPWVTGGVAALLAVLAAASLGRLPGLEAALARTPGWATRLGGSSPTGAYGMGLAAGVVFAPCTGPFVVGVLAYVASTGELAFGGALLACVGLGLGAPFVALAAFATEIARLPRLGALADLPRFLLALLLAAAALYYLSLAVPEAWLRAVGVLALGALAADRVAVAARPGRGAWAVPALALLAAGALLASGYAPWSAAPRGELAWRSDVDAALAEARAEGRFAVIDFTADWCLACHELEERTFSAPEPAALLARAERIRVDASRMTERIERLFERFEVRGLPAVVLVDPQGRRVEGARIDSFVSPEEAVRRWRRAGLGGETRESRGA